MKRLLIALAMCGLLVGVVAADTLIVYSLEDGQVSNTTFTTSASTKYTGIGNLLDRTGGGAYVGFSSTANSSEWKNNHRVGFVFPTGTGLSANYTSSQIAISSATVYLYPYFGGAANEFTGTPGGGFMLVGFLPTSNTTLQESDYNKNLTVRLSDKDMNVAEANSAAYHSFPLNAAGVAAISKTNAIPTDIMVITNWSYNSFAPSWESSKGLYWRIETRDAASHYPYIQVVYTVAPPSLTSLTNSSPSCNSLQFNYTVPAGVGEILVYRNNTQLANLTNSSAGVLWDGLPESTAITFSARTCSIDGLVCNSTWTNMTTNTEACGVAPVANFTANATNICIGDSVQFNDTSENIPTSWNWSFGDGNYSTVQDPLFQFNVPGTFNINLTATNAYGSDFENKTGYITVGSCEQPTPTPTATPTLCYYVNATGATIADNFTNLSFNAGPSSWGVTVWNQSEGNISWWQCGSLNVSTGDGGSGGGEATGAALGLVGGLVGALIVLRRDEK